MKNMLRAYIETEVPPPAGWPPASDPADDYICLLWGNSHQGLYLGIQIKVERTAEAQDTEGLNVKP